MRPDDEPHIVDALVPQAAAERDGAPTIVVAVTARTIVFTAAVLVGVVLALRLGALAWESITLLLVAVFLALALDPAVGALAARGLPRGVAAAVVLLAALALIAGIVAAVVPPLVSAVDELADALPRQLRRLEAGEGPLGVLERRFHVGESLMETYRRGGAAALLGLERPGIDAARALAGTALALVAVPFLTYFMLLDGGRWVEGALRQLSPSAAARWRRVIDGVRRTVSGYVTGNLAISAVAASVALLVLLATGVPYALPLALLVAVLDLVPIVGATVAVVVCGLAATSVGLTATAIVVVTLVVYQQVENHVLQPLVYGRSVDLSPLAIIVSVVVGAQLAGILGALAAIPIAGSLAVVARELVSWRTERHRVAGASGATRTAGEIPTSADAAAVAPDPAGTRHGAG